MSLDLMHLQAELEPQPEKHPSWVSAENKSLEAWRVLQALEKERQAYIKNHRQPEDFKKTSLWQIRVSEVAKAIAVQPSYLDPNRGVKWSSNFREALDKCNKGLAKKKGEPSRNLPEKKGQWSRCKKTR